MDRTAIYRKTDKGHAEITGTSRAVDRRLRPLLILVDGHRTATRIHALISGIGIREEDFDHLVRGGYIEKIVLPNTEAANEGIGPAGLPPPVVKRTSVERFSDGQRYLNEMAGDKLGLKSFFLVLKIEKSSSAEDLMALLPDFETALAKKFDSAYAQHCARIARSILQD